VLLLLLALLCPPSAFAARRLVRDVAGLPASSTLALAEGPDGRVWAGTYLGLWVVDGAAGRRVAEAALPGLVTELVADAEGRLWALHEDGAVVVILDEPGEGRSEAAFACEAGTCPSLGWRDVRALARGPDGRPLLLRGDAVWALSAAGAWAQVASIPGGVGLFSDGRAAYVEARGSLLRLDPRGPVEVAALEGALVGVATLPGDPEGLAGLDWEGRLWAFSGGERRLLLDDPGRGISLLRRGDTLWVSVDRALLAWRDDVVERISGADGARGGGPLLETADGALWLGDFLGVHLFPEPETGAVSEADGLVSDHARTLVGVGDRLWVATWQGLSAVRPGGQVVSNLPGVQVEGGFCGEGEGAWAGARDMRGGDGLGGPRFVLLRLDAAGARTIPWATEGWPRGCALDAEGRPWFTTTDGLWTLEGGAPVARATGAEWDGLPATTAEGLVVVGRSAALWVRDGQVARRLPLSIQSRVTRVLPLEARLWVATEGDGLWSIDREGAERVALDGATTPRHILGLTRTAEGVWLSGQGTLMRVSEEARPRLLERVGGAQGLLADGAEAVLPDGQGTLRLATSAGLVRVPERARALPLAAPAPLLAAPPLGRQIQGGGGAWSLPAPPNELLLSFALPAWRDGAAGRLRARVDDRLHSLPGGALRIVDLKPGEHEIAVESSLDGRSWTAGPALRLTVATPFYLRPSFLFAGMVGLSAAGLLIHRARVAALLRVERERSRIALDLHDELGSGLAGVSALAGMAADPDIDPEGRLHLAATIARVSEELGAALGDIVWSLRRDTADPAALLASLAERGNRMLAPRGGEVIPLPLRGSVAPLSLPVRRALQRIGVEALHNAARHGDARRVELSIEPGLGRSPSVFRVRDDGRPNGAGSAGSGLGLPGMRARAEAIGGQLVAGPVVGGGFLVEVTFRPEAGGALAGPAWLRRLR
jgi:signal transduction histidine kinase